MKQTHSSDRLTFTLSQTGPTALDKRLPTTFYIEEGPLPSLRLNVHNSERKTTHERYHTTHRCTEYLSRG